MTPAPKARLKPLRLRFWLLALDVVARLGGYGSPLYLWVLSRASACVEWT